MELVTVRDLFKHTADYAGKTVSVGGWVRFRPRVQDVRALSS